MALMQNYSRFPLRLEKGKGSYVWDEKGIKYLDYTAGIATCNLGHVPEYVKAKVQDQLETLWHCSNLYQITNQEKLAQLLVDHSCFDQAFFCNSGAEANEAAIKLARKYGKDLKGESGYEIVTFNQSFHGRTMATLSATGQTKIQVGFEPLLPGFTYLPYNDLTAISQINPQTTAAVLLELVQGEGGVIAADPNWVKALVDFCQKHEILVMVDEVQTGMGRTGSLFAYQQYDFEPDVIALAKGLGSGFPIGAMLAKKHVAKTFQPGSHGSTFGGNPLATSAGLATLEYLVENEIAIKAKNLGDYLKRKLLTLQSQYSQIKDIRGLGLLQGLFVGNLASEIVGKAREMNLLVLQAGPDVVRILPPLTTTETEIDQCVNILDQVFASL